MLLVRPTYLCSNCKAPFFTEEDLPDLIKRTNLTPASTRVIPDISSCSKCSHSLPDILLAEMNKEGNINIYLKGNKYPDEKPGDVSSSLEFIRSVSPGSRLPSGAQLAVDLRPFQNDQ